MANSRDVARAAGVSQATVSRVLSGAAVVNAATRQRVEQAMREVGYLPNRSARAMRTGKTGTIGVVVADLANPFYPELVEALSRVLDERGVRLNVWVADGAKNNAALQAIADRSVDGVVFTTVDEESAELRSALDRASPFVLVNRTLPGVACDQVSSANVDGSRLVTEHLLGLGCRRLAFIGGTAASSTTTERMRGFRAALAAAGVEPGPVTTGSYTHESGHERARALLRGPGPIDAFVCSNDLLAIGALNAAHERGVDVPRDVKVTGYDDVGPAGWAKVSLTTVRQDVDLLARRAVEVLLARIESPTVPPQRLWVDPVLVTRGSTRRP